MCSHTFPRSTTEAFGQQLHAASRMPEHGKADKASCASTGYPDQEAGLLIRFLSPPLAHQEQLAPRAGNVFLPDHVESLAEGGEEMLLGDGIEGSHTDSIA